MEIVYPRSCGVDVHKSFIVAVICISESVKPKYIKKRFSTFNNQLIQFRDWLIENNCQNVCMESTGKYYIPVYNALEGHISNVVLPILNGSRLSKVRRMTIRMPNGLLTSLNLVLSDPAISLKRISASSGNLPAISINLSICVLLKRIVSKML